MSCSTGRALGFIVICLGLSAISFPYFMPIAFGMLDIFGARDVVSLEDNVLTCIVTICSGNDNNDIIIGSFLSETIYGLKGDDNIQGNEGADVIYGGEGGDTIQGGSGVDKLFGQEGNDYLYADSSTSIVGRGGIEQNKIDVGIRANDSSLFLKTPQSSEEKIVRHDNNNGIDMFAPLNVDVLILGESFLDGGNGDDHIYGGSGNDFLVGGPGHDVFDCGEGIDQVLDFNPREDTASTNCEIIK